jgi:peptidoglycan/LPS O-acetylase OafA/YrhL
MTPNRARTGNVRITMALGGWIREELEVSSNKNTIAFLDGVRGFACLMVIWFHIYRLPRDLHIWNPSTSTYPLLDSLLFFGRNGVTLFFVLSGFLLFLPFAKALLFEQTGPSTRRFYLRRVFRILPAYYLALILIVLLFQRQYLQPQHWQELGLFFTMFMDSSQATYKQLNAPFWTLAIEWQYYLLLPWLVLGMRQIVWHVKQRYRMTVTISLLLVLIAWGLFSRYFGVYFQQHPSETFLVPRSALNVFLFFTFGTSGKYLEDFGVGMLLALCFVYIQHPSVSSTIRIALHKLSTWLLGTGVLCLLALVLWDYHPRFANTWPLFSNPFLYSYSYLFNELCLSLAFSLCLFALLFGTTRLKRPFEWSPLRKVGTISFSLYMWHLPFIFLFIQWGQPLLKGWTPEQSYGIYCLWILLVVIPFCILFFILVEKPGIKLGEWINQRKSKNAHPAVQTSPSEHDRLEPRNSPQRHATSPLTPVSSSRRV